MRPVIIGNRGGPLDDGPDINGSLQPSECNGSASKDLKPLVQISKNVRVRPQSSAVNRESTYDRGAALRGFDPTMFKHADAKTRQGIGGFGRVKSVRLGRFREE